ncbi:helix-turn-helix transcriptional regulator [Roseibium album]|uniref:helix-turn-helix transcriptional regulator n=1 Tax=Roseibium album TaxID=311410 RepID=UPI0006D842B4|nr:AlpA family phage regulatory protein [Roseibium album]
MYKHQDKLVDISELSSALGGISRSTIYRHINKTQGFPKPIKIGSLTRFKASEIEQFIVSQRHAQEGIEK